jgi:hypothetical protein
MAFAPGFISISVTVGIVTLFRIPCKRLDGTTNTTMGRKKPTQTVGPDGLSRCSYGFSILMLTNITVHERLRPGKAKEEKGKKEGKEDGQGQGQTTKKSMGIPSVDPTSRSSD